METGLGDVEITVHSLLECLKKEENQPKRSAPSIYRVDNILKDHSLSSYNPRVVSIGPLHREDKNLQAGEEEKIAHVFSLLSRLDLTQEETMQVCTRKVNASINHIRSCYAETISYNNIELTKMMVIDGCFILKYIYRLSNPKESHLGNMTFVMLTIYDLVLLENQIPFLVLQHIFDCTIAKFDQTASLINMIHPLLEYFNLFIEHELKSSSNSTPHHILGLLHECYHYKDAVSSANLNSRFPSVVELDRAGVNFKRARYTEWPLMMEVKSHRLPCFSCSWGNPTLTMPVLEIHDSTELILRNLIAYEQYSDNVSQYFTSYAIAIDMLIDTREDVATLVESEVIINRIGSNQEAANMINNLSKVVYWRDFFYYDQWMELNRHYNGKWSKNIAWLRCTYFNNPWNIIALFAAILLFALTIVQTVFTVNPA
ncbi:putative UPF0481 protein At3g02645 [Bidens hawaiensis]|uniref:putative UPF0481 protein At3g02645 n=1 Tax=Bidens hawaiensis TaxID=980011 RepID=UPI0040490BDF